MNYIIGFIQSFKNSWCPAQWGE